MSKVSVQTALEGEGVDVPTVDRELEVRFVPGVLALLGFVQDVWARLTSGRPSDNRMVFEDRHSAAALIGLFGMKHG
jgi:hypothetical protein